MVFSISAQAEELFHLKNLLVDLKTGEESHKQTLGFTFDLSIETKSTDRDCRRAKPCYGPCHELG